MKKILIFIISILGYSLYSQNLENAKIDESLINYFKLDRENIYLHLNKSSYLSNETIWFKGYIIEKKESKLNFETTNVYVSLLDENNLEISNQLFYAANGVVLGQIKINESLPSGKYYIHIYTNYMNNFSENESSVQSLTIINIADKIIEDTNNSNFEPTLYTAYEGGKLLANSDNTVGVYIEDCFGTGLKVNDIKVKNSKGDVINSFATNSEGYGKFDLLNTTLELYTLELNYNNTTVTKKLELPSLEGVTISAVNYADDTKLLLTVKTNEESLKKHKNKNYSIIIQKNDQGNTIDFILDATKKEFVINQSVLSTGINTIRLIDNNLNSISERIIYHNPNPNKISITSTKIKDSIKISGKINDRIANFSVSSLPKGVSQNKFNSIFTQLIFKNNCTINKLNADYYFENFNKRKKYELDLVLLHSETNYKWSSIITTVPKETYSFDVGLTIEGKVNQNVTSKEKLRLFSINGINETTTLNKKNEFEFKNILAIDSSSFHFSLIKNDEKLVSLNLYPRVLNNNRKFYKKPDLKNPICVAEKFVKNDYNTNVDFPKLENVTILKDVEVVEVKKVKLEREREYSNAMSKGYKINDSDVTSYRDVLSFIASHGYDVSREGGNVTIVSRITKSILGSRTPAVFLDNSPMVDFTYLLNLQLTDIDEIYVNKHGYGMGGDGSNGSIRIYTKKTSGVKQNASMVKSKTLNINKGFQKLMEFENQKYANLKSESFLKYGTIDWQPNIYTDENGNFEVTIPHLNQDEILLSIQGIDNLGEVYHKNFTVKVE